MIPRWTLPVFVLAAIAAVGTAAPVLAVAAGAGAASPSGFGRGWSDLSRLAIRSVLVAAAPAVIAALLALLCSVLARASSGFRGFYRAWVFAMLFTNPVLLVFGLGSLLTSLPASLAVGAVSTIVLMPFTGAIVQSAAEGFPEGRALAARALGATAFRATLDHFVPYLLPFAAIGVGAGCVFALGFFLIPAYVGLGRVSTLGTAIDRAANQVGDWQAACQLGLVALGAELVCAGAVVAALGLVRRLGRGLHACPS